MAELGILADDLTGAMMIASLIEQRGRACALVTEAGRIGEAADRADVVVLGRKLRFAEIEVARREAQLAHSAFQAAGISRIGWKYSAAFDTTRAGTIGPVAEELLELTGAAQTILCPAFVEWGVTVYQGHLFLGAALLTDSFKQYDPVSPPWTSNLAEVLKAQSSMPVGVLTHQSLARGREALLAELGSRKNERLLIADAIDAADIERVVDLTRDWPLVTGSDSFLPAYAVAITDRTADRPGTNRRFLPPAPGRQAVLAGSCAPQTLAQIDAFDKSNPVFRIELARPGDEQALADEALDWALIQPADKPLLIAVSAAPDGVASAQARYGVRGAAERAEAVLGAVARGLFTLGVRQFVVAGGETSGAVFSALGASRFEVCGFDELCGGYCHASDLGPTSFVIKAGSMGGPTFFADALARLAAADRR